MEIGLTGRASKRVFSAFYRHAAARVYSVTALNFTLDKGEKAKLPLCPAAAICRKIFFTPV